MRQATFDEVVTAKNHVDVLFHAMRVRCASEDQARKSKSKKEREGKEKKRTSGGRYQDACLECENSREIMAILKVFLREAGRSLSRKAKEH